MTNTLAILRTISLIAIVSTTLTGSHCRGEDNAFPEFSELNLNGDQKISKDDLSSHAKSRFGSADQNKNSTLSAAEMIAQHVKVSEQRINKMIRKMDNNDNEHFSFEEVQNRCKKMETSQNVQ